MSYDVLLDDSMLCKLCVFGKNGIFQVYGLNSCYICFSVYGIFVNYDFFTIRNELCDEFVYINLLGGVLGFRSGFFLACSKYVLKLVIVPKGYALGGLLVVLNSPSCPLLFGRVYVGVTR